MSALVGAWMPSRGILVWQPADPEEFYRYRTGDACGTPKGYWRHRRAREDACQPCRAARSAQEKGYRVRGAR